MSNPRRVQRINSLLREVLTEVIRKDVKNPNVEELVTVSHVSTSKDLRHAKVYISVIGDEEKRRSTVEALETASGFISVRASKKVTMRFFPELTFLLDEGVEKQMRIDSLLEEINKEKNDSTA